MRLINTHLHYDQKLVPCHQVEAEKKHASQIVETSVPTICARLHVLPAVSSFHKIPVNDNQIITKKQYSRSTLASEEKEDACPFFTFLSLLLCDKHAHSLEQLFVQHVNDVLLIDYRMPFPYLHI